jgi:hypothetical protein
MQGTKTMTPAQRAKAAKDEMPDDKVLNQSMMFVMGEVFGWFNSNKDTIREALEQMADEWIDANIGRHVCNGWIVHPNGRMYDAANHAVVPREPTRNQCADMEDLDFPEHIGVGEWQEYWTWLYKAMIGIAAQESSSEWGGE